MSKLSIIIPCYYNEDNIPVTGRTLVALERKFPKGTRFEYVFVDDGSGDKTYKALVALHRAYPKRVTIVKLTRNFGANNASLAGLTQATGDAIAILAADLQDPPELLPTMYSHWRHGAKLVIANRIARHDSLFSMLLSGLYHWLMRSYVLTNAPRGGFDLVLFDKKVQADITSAREKNFFLPYFLMWLGYPYVTIPYTRRKRAIGASRWTLSKRIKTFIDSFVSFTYLPLRLISACGLVLSIVALVYAVFVIVARLQSGIPVEGWTSLVIILLFVSSFQMIALGIIGEYLWRTLDAARGRHPYIIEAVLKKS